MANDTYEPWPIAVVGGVAHAIYPPTAGVDHVTVRCTGTTATPSAWYADSLDYGFAVGAHLRAVDQVVECDQSPCRSAYVDDSGRPHLVANT